MQVQQIKNHQQNFGMAKLGKNLEALFSYAKKDCKTGFDFEMLDKARRNFEELPCGSVEISKLYPKNFWQRVFSGPKNVVHIDDKLSFTINPLIKQEQN